MAIKPLHDRVVIERVEAESKTSGGIIIPDNAKEKPAEGIVVAVGSGLKDSNGKQIALDVTEIKFEGKELVILKESDILAIINK
jgi:chaperonin GroES